MGQIDVLLLSSQGRVAVVETKLATNPELRRHVRAQVLGYPAHPPGRFNEEIPEIHRDENGRPVAAQEDILESVAQGDTLMIVASYEVDHRVAKVIRLRKS